MKYLTVFVAATLLLFGTMASAQEMGPEPGVAELTLMPGGGMFFSHGKNESSFDNYHLGGALAFNFNKYVGVEAELVGSLGISQNLTYVPAATPGSAITNKQRTPDTLGYTGNLVLSAPAGHGAFPYVTGGIGGLTMFQNTGLAINSDATFFTGNVGGGLKWYANNRVGFRADYRFLMVRASDTAPAFFGQEDRYGHRIYGGLMLNMAP